MYVHIWGPLCVLFAVFQLYQDLNYLSTFPLHVVVHYTSWYVQMLVGRDVLQLLLQKDYKV